MRRIFVFLALLPLVFSWMSVSIQSLSHPLEVKPNEPFDLVFLLTAYSNDSEKDASILFTIYDGKQNYEFKRTTCVGKGISCSQVHKISFVAPPNEATINYTYVVEYSLPNNSLAEAGSGSVAISVHPLADSKRITEHPWDEQRAAYTSIASLCFLGIFVLLVCLLGIESIFSAKSPLNALANKSAEWISFLYFGSLAAYVLAMSFSYVSLDLDLLKYAITSELLFFAGIMGLSVSTLKQKFQSEQETNSILWWLPAWFRILLIFVAVFFVFAYSLASNINLFSLAFLIFLATVLLRLISYYLNASAGVAEIRAGDIAHSLFVAVLFSIFLLMALIKVFGYAFQTLALIPAFIAVLILFHPLIVAAQRISRGLGIASDPRGILGGGFVAALFILGLLIISTQWVVMDRLSPYPAEVRFQLIVSLFVFFVAMLYNVPSFSKSEKG